MLFEDIKTQSRALGVNSSLVADLNFSQRQAVTKSLAHPVTGGLFMRFSLLTHFLVIQGPPGTGKTTTIACITNCLADVNPLEGMSVSHQWAF